MSWRHHELFVDVSHAADDDPPGGGPRCRPPPRDGTGGRMGRPHWTDAPGRPSPQCLYGHHGCWRSHPQWVAAIKSWHDIPESQVDGANMGPSWDRQDPGGPHVGPMNLAIWDVTLVVITGSIIIVPLWSSEGHSPLKSTHYVNQGFLYTV